MLSCRDPWSCGAGLSDRAWLDGCAHVGAVPLPTSQLGPWRWDHAPTRPPALGDTAVRRLRRGRGATADVPAGTVAMDHVPTRPLGLGDTAKHVPTRAPASATPRIDGSAYVGGATADVPAGTGGDQHLFWGGDARILVAVRDPLQENQVSHRGGRACGRGGQARTWLAGAVVRGCPRAEGNHLPCVRVPAPRPRGCPRPGRVHRPPRACTALAFWRCCRSQAPAARRRSRSGEPTCCGLRPSPRLRGRSRRGINSGSLTLTDRLGTANR